MVGLITEQQEKSDIQKNVCPGQHNQRQSNQLCGAAHVLGPLGQQRVQVEGDTVHSGFNGRVEQLDDQCQQWHQYQQQALDRGYFQQTGQRQ